MRKNDVFPLVIEEINNLGNGVGHLPGTDGGRGMVVFVPGAVTGDEIDARVIKVTKSYLVARVETLRKPSPYRTDDFCPARGCGGCVYRNLDYAHELELKRGYVQNAFRKAGLPDVRVGEVRTTGKLTGYRNKAQYPVAAGKDGMVTGFFAPSSHRVVPVGECLLQPPEFAGLTDYVCRFADRFGITVYDETAGEGLLRHIYIRKGVRTGETMVCLVVNGTSLPGERELADGLMKTFPGVVSVMLNVNRENTNVILGDVFRCLGGKEEIEDELCSLRFGISAGSFYQVNHDACELLYGIAGEKAALTGSETLLDLYCGIGTIGLSLAAKAREVIGVEIVEEAVRCAGENAARNGIANAHFYCGDASDARKLLDNAERAHGSVDGATVVMDPPRKGSTPELIRYLCERGFPKIVYVSCNPDTLARDCKLFSELGYTVGEATPVDLFPRTGHVETVVLMSRDKE